MDFDSLLESLAVSDVFSSICELLAAVPIGFVFGFILWAVGFFVTWFIGLMRQVV